MSPVKTQLFTDTFTFSNPTTRQKRKKLRPPRLPLTQEQLDKRRQYEANRANTPEHKLTLHKSQAKRRLKAIESDLCVQCYDKAIPGPTKCPTCRDAHRWRVNAAATRKREAKAATKQ